MSVQAGIWNLDGTPISREFVARLSNLLQAAGPDGEFSYVRGAVALLYRPFHTTAESRREVQPLTSKRGFVLTWDGRIDNRSELIGDLDGAVSADSTDAEIVAAAYEHWSTDAFSRFVGDWALALWNPIQREVILAVDFMAIRNIFYCNGQDSLRWSSDLSALVLSCKHKLHLDDRYIAGYFALQPDGHVTPYREIQQVPPGHWVRFCNGRAFIERHWKFTAKRRLRYSSDRDYEEHFRHAFRQAVRRRLRTDAPVLAELSGGLDSSSIVCVADEILSREPVAPRLDTLSLFNNSEPDGDDSRFFPKVEALRGRAGIHIDTSRFESTSTDLELREFTPLPGSLRLGVGSDERDRAMREGRYRAVLSGIGGDEFMGGIPDPSRQLAELISAFRFITLGRELVRWGLAKRRPALHLLGRGFLELLPVSISHVFIKQAKVETWIDKSFAARHRVGRRLVTTTAHTRAQFFASRARVDGVQFMANRMAKQPAAGTRGEEFRYPYLDQHLVEFVLSIPSSQLLRPGERRSLMRRSLAGIVPQEILSRRTKQFAALAPVQAFGDHLNELREVFQSPLIARLGYVDCQRMLGAIEGLANGQEFHLVRMFRAISLEYWLRHQKATETIDLGLSVAESKRKKTPEGVWVGETRNTATQ